MEKVWQQILPYAQTYPSPHNSQPMRVRLRGDTMALYYDLDRGLPAESFGVAFGHVCAGVFVEIVRIAAAGLGYELEERLELRPIDFGAANRLHPLGTLRLVKAERALGDLDPVLIMRRRTSRLPYEPRPVPEAVLARAAAEAQPFGYRLHSTTDPKLVKEVIYVNQRTLFYDLSDPAVRHELSSWLRYSRQQAEATGDGLSAECLDLPGPVMKLFMTQYWVWQLPLLGRLVKWVYLHSMRGVAQVAWLVGPFAGPADYMRAGRCLMRIWLELTEAGVYLHPFGSVIANERAHREFCELVGEAERGGMAWMLFRLGYSREPPRAHRRPLSEMVLP